MNGQAWGFYQPWWHYTAGAVIMGGCVAAYRWVPLGHTWYWMGLLIGVILGTGTVLLYKDTTNLGAPRPVLRGRERWATWCGLRRDPTRERDQWQRLQAAGRRAFVMRNWVFGWGVMTGLAAPMFIGPEATQPLLAWGVGLLLFMGGGYIGGRLFWRWMAWSMAKTAN